jgi:hypothetical protein
VVNDKGKATSSEEEASRAKSWKNGEESSKEADKRFTETADVSEKDRGAGIIDRQSLLTFASANSQGFYPPP